MAKLNDIITSRVRVKILELLLTDVREIYHVRGMVRQTNEEINAVRRELERLEKAGIVKKEPRGNRLYYWARKDYSFFEDLLAIVSKSTGLGVEIIANQKKLGNLSFVMFSGKFARRKTRKKEDDVDVLVVGKVVLPELATLIRAEESKRDGEINYTVMSRDELAFRKRRRDPFLLRILAESRIMIIGDEDDLVT
ncbi:winged helix-turn-helix domain-containing protein [Patescibacteria group bacterium]